MHFNLKKKEENGMSPKKDAQTRQDVESKLIRKAGKNEGFREQLKKDPREVFSSQGIVFPKKVKIKVVEESPNVMYIVLPATPVKAAARSKGKDPSELRIYSIVACAKGKASLHNKELIPYSAVSCKKGRIHTEDLPPYGPIACK